MPPAYVKTIREEIFYEYAKLISRSAYGTLQRGFITGRFKKSWLWGRTNTTTWITEGMHGKSHCFGA